MRQKYHIKAPIGVIGRQSDHFASIEAFMTQDKLEAEKAVDRHTLLAFDPLVESRRLLRSVRAGSLATMDASGHPFASLVNVATAADGAPILLLSQLAGHTKHLEADPRCAILLAEAGKGDPLAHPRLTVVGTLARDGDPVLRERFLRRHPKSALYADFGDFSFWRMDVARAHINGGFARAGQVDGAALLLDLAGAQALLEAEGSACDHMNADHRDALSLYARHFAREDDGPWRTTGFDPEGMDLIAGERTARIVFPQRIVDAGGLRRCLVALATEARAAA